MTLMRTAFSTVVRESQDLACGVFDRNGNMMAQSLTGTPGHINTMATGMRHFMAAYPPDDARAGRRADHQRPLADGRPDQRHDRRHAGVPPRRAWSPSSPPAATRPTSAAASTAAARTRSTRRASGSRSCTSCGAASRTRRWCGWCARTCACPTRRSATCGRRWRATTSARATWCGSSRSSTSRLSRSCRRRDHRGAPRRRCARRSARCPTAPTRNESWGDGFNDIRAIAVAVTIDGD